MTEYIGLYADRELQVPLPRIQIDDKLYWSLNFGKIDAGQTRVFRIYIENKTTSVIEDLEISARPVDRLGVAVTLYRNKVSRLGMTDVHEFYVEWKVAGPDDVKAGKAKVDLYIEGIITEEE